MDITTPILAGAAHLAALPGDSVTSFLKMIGEGTGLFDDGPDGGLGMVMSGLSGIAAALAVAIFLTVYFRSGYRTLRDVVKHGVATLAVLTGGFAREELLEAGAASVFESLAELINGLAQTPLR